MSHQIRPGARGGRDQFSWDQVKEDKLRLNYLGSSIHGVPDKYKKGPEAFWYAKEPAKTMSGSETEIRNVKDKEKQMMESLLGGSSSGGLLKPKLVKTVKPDIIQRRDHSPGKEHYRNHRDEHNYPYSKNHREDRSSNNRTSNRDERDSSGLYDSKVRPSEVNRRERQPRTSRYESNRHEHSEVNRSERHSSNRYSSEVSSNRYSSEVSSNRYSSEVSSNRYSSEASGDSSRTRQHRYNESLTK